MVYILAIIGRALIQYLIGRALVMSWIDEWHEKHGRGK